MSKERWPLRKIYLYLVCLITLIMVIVGIASAVRAAVEIIYPDPGYYGEVPLDEDGEPMYSEQEWVKEQELQRKSERRYAIISLVGSLSYVVVAGPVYLYHWRKIEKELEGSNDIASSEASADQAS